MIIFLGIAGAGKGTQAELLHEHYQAAPLSTGEILRSHENDKRIKNYLREGVLVPDEVLLPIIEKEAIKRTKAKTQIIFDGFPRTLSQAKWLVHKINEGKFKLSGIIHFQLSREVAKQRLLKRHRYDDTEDIIDKRFAQYEQNILPLVNYFRSEGFKIHDINADQPVEKVFQDLKSALGI